MSEMPQCFQCRHYIDDDGKPRCAAFPTLIPVEIFAGEHDHAEPYPGDGGILYERKPDRVRVASPARR